MLIANISLIGWLHTIACIVALAAGAWNIVMPKGTPIHRRIGLAYVFAMLVANISILAVYRFDVAKFRPFTAGPNTFGLFHWEAVTTLIALLLAIYAAPRQRRAVWAYTHPIAMLVTYYMLIGGLINELFVRVAPLRALVRAQMHGPAGFFATRAVGLTQFAAMIVFFVLLVYFIAKVAVARHGRRAASVTA